jgi:hypothetical protein
MAPEIRDDLAEAHRLAWSHIAEPGCSFSGRERVELASTVLQALVEPEPLAPWVKPSTVGRFAEASTAPVVAHDFVYRLARHAGTVTEDVHRQVAEHLGELAFVELCAITSTVSAVAHFHRNVGLPTPPLPEPVPGEPTGRAADQIVEAKLNWVPVAAPADSTAAVRQAYSALPDEYENTWRMASAQYIPADEMIHADWSRGPHSLTRAQMELVAARVAQLRECFY